MWLRNSEAVCWACTLVTTNKIARCEIECHNVSVLIWEDMKFQKCLYQNTRTEHADVIRRQKWNWDSTVLSITYPFYSVWYYIYICIAVCYNERKLQRTVFINKARMLQQTQILIRKRKNAIGRRSTRVCVTFQAFPLWFECQSLFFLSFVKISCQFSSVICLFLQCIKV